MWKRKWERGGRWRDSQRGVVVKKLVADTITSVMGFSHSACIWGPYAWLTSCLESYDIYLTAIHVHIISISNTKQTLIDVPWLHLPQGHVLWSIRSRIWIIYQRSSMALIRQAAYTSVRVCTLTCLTRRLRFSESHVSHDRMQCF